MSPAETPGNFTASSDLSPQTVALALAMLAERPGLSILLRSALLDRDAVCAVLGIGTTRLVEAIAAGDWPKPEIPLGRGGRWRVQTVCSAIDRLAERGLTILEDRRPAAARPARPPGRPPNRQLVRKPTAKCLAIVNVAPIGTSTDPLKLVCGVCGSEWEVRGAGPSRRLPSMYWRCPKGCNAHQHDQQQEHDATEPRTIPNGTAAAGTVGV